jgi:hypothetical protein
MRVPARLGRLVPFVAALAVVTACVAPHKLISARHTKCPVRKLEIRDLSSGPDREDWIALCGARSFACSTREKERRLVYACHALDAGTEAPQDGGAAAIPAEISAPCAVPDAACDAGDAGSAADAT